MYEVLMQLLKSAGIKWSALSQVNGSAFKMSKALSKLEKAGGIHGIKEPSEWERGIRVDRN